MVFSKTRIADHQTLPIRLPEKDERGQPFIEWLNGRVHGNRQARQRLVAFIEEWDLLRDEVLERDGREPTVEEYATRWDTPISTAYRLLGEFKSAIGIDGPGPLCQLLWDGMPRFDEPGSTLGSLMAVEVVPIRGR